MLRTYHQQSLAFELLKRNARIKIIHTETGLPIQFLRDAYQQFHGHSASCGGMKESTNGLTRNIKTYKEAILFAGCFWVAISKMECIDIKKVIIAFDTFKKLHPNSQLDFSGAWVIAQDLKNRKVEITTCHHCKSTVLLHARTNKFERCVVCNTSLKDKLSRVAEFEP
ncbi:MAG: FlhC family transcriptional regulator [Methylomonas sp.]|jgi:hypothetical protein